MIPVPDLDTIRFDDLVEEGRSLIPRYAPEWTDHNLHDPGITLLDLLAWIVDQQVYRIGTLGDAHLAAFAAMFGIERRAAVAARGLLWAPGAELSSGTIIRPGCRIYPREQPELLFTILRDVRLCAAGISNVLARQAGSAATPVDADPKGQMPLPPDTSVIDIGLDPPISPGEDEEAAFTIGLAYSEALPELGGRLPATVDYCDGEGAWHRAQTKWQASAANDAGALLVEPAPDHAVQRIRLGLEAGLPRRFVPARIGLNAVPIVQLEMVPAVKIGEGTGWPDLELDFGVSAIPEKSPGFHPLAIHSLPAGGDPIPWSEVRDFSRSGAQDAHFRFEGDRSVLVFGNGVNGRAPQLGEQISRGPIHVTKGAAGNIDRMVEWVVPGLEAEPPVVFRNLDPVTGGADAWTADHLMAEVRRRARQRAAMLTNGELRAAALDLQGFGVGQAEVLPRYDPSLVSIYAPGARTLLLRPQSGIDVSDAWLDAIESELAPRRVLGERLSVAAVQPVPIDIAATLVVAPGAALAQVRKEAARILRQRLSLTNGSCGSSVKPWPSGRPVTIGEIEALLSSTSGVVAVREVNLARSGEARACLSLPLERMEAAVLGDVFLHVEVRSR